MKIGKLNPRAEELVEIALNCGWEPRKMPNGGVMLSCGETHLPVPPVRQWNESKYRTLRNKLLTYGDPDKVTAYKAAKGIIDHLPEPESEPEPTAPVLVDVPRPSEPPAPKPGPPLQPPLPRPELESAEPVGARRPLPEPHHDPVLTRPWDYDLDHWPPGVQSLRFYYTPSLNVRLFADGSPPLYECSKAGCGYRSTNVLSAGVHWARSADHLTVTKMRYASGSGFQVELPSPVEVVPSEPPARTAADELLDQVRALVSADLAADVATLREHTRQLTSQLTQVVAERDAAQTELARLAEELTGVQELIGSLTRRPA